MAVAQLDLTAIELTLHVFRVCYEDDNGGVTDAEAHVPVIPRLLYKHFAVPLPADKWTLRSVLHSTPYHGRRKAAGCVFTGVANNKSHVVAFRGTNRLAEWEHNLRGVMKSVCLADEPAAAAQAGYLDLFNTIEDLDELLHELEGDGHEVLFTGHSLGGAMATLAAAHFKSLHPEVRVSLVVFGAPRIVNASLRAWLEQRLAHAAAYERATDPVPTALLRWTQGVHVGERRELASFGHAWWVYPLCHDMLHYHRAMCLLHNAPYTPLIRWKASLGLSWLAQKMEPPA